MKAGKQGRVQGNGSKLFQENKTSFSYVGCLFDKINNI